MSRVSSVDIVAKLCAGCPRNRGSLIGGAEVLCLLQSFSPGYGAHRYTCLMDTGCSFPWIFRP